MKVKFSHPEYSSKELESSVLKILNSVELCSMSTITQQKESYINTAYFCFSDELDLYFISDTSTVHCENINYSSSMAMAIFNTNQPWDDDHQGLQLFGNTIKTTDKDSIVALNIYSKRFKDYGDYVKELSPTQQRSTSYKFFKFRPEIVKIFDEVVFGGEVYIEAAIMRG